MWRFVFEDVDTHQEFLVEVAASNPREARQLANAQLPALGAYLLTEGPTKVDD